MMTQIPERPENEPGAFGVSTRALPSKETTGNEATEKSARDQLKKTSLASLSQNITDPSISDDESRVEGDARQPASARCVKRSPSPRRHEELRGRPIKKRSLDQPESPGGGAASPMNQDSESHKEYHRKRSCDSQASEPVREEMCLQNTLSQPMHSELMQQREGQDATMSFPRNDAQLGVVDTVINKPAGAFSQVERKGNHLEIISTQQSGGVGSDSVPTKQDFEKDGACSPRRKRSREDIGVEADREQKIAATDENRANRRSDEIQREVARHTNDIRSTGKQPEISSEYDTLKDNIASQKDDRHLSKVSPAIAFGAPSTLCRSTTNTKIKSDTQDDENINRGTFSHYNNASSSALASNIPEIGKSFHSPFGALVPSSRNLGEKIFGSSQSTLRAAENTAELRATASTASVAPIGSFSHAHNSSPSPFATASPLTGTTFGGSVQNSAFGEGYGGGSRLTSFAAPAGDAKLGTMNGTLLPLGSKGHEDDDGEASDTEASGAEDKSRDGEDDEADGRFQHQAVETGEDGEESVFSSRASLYAFKGGSWKESGKGTFKLNVVEGACAAEKTGRFIMRAHQTYRVLLNAPIIPQMKVGDSRGEEPSAKSFAFAVVEDGKPTPYMVKLSDVHESQALYHKVRSLQRGDVRFA